MNQALAKSNKQLRELLKKNEDLESQRKELREVKDRNTLRIADLELQVALQSQEADAAAEREEVLRRDQKKIMVQLEAAHTCAHCLQTNRVQLQFVQKLCLLITNSCRALPAHWTVSARHKIPGLMRFVKI